MKKYYRGTFELVIEGPIEYQGGVGVRQHFKMSKTEWEMVMCHLIPQMNSRIKSMKVISSEVVEE
jgi:hypothetical protein